MKCPKCGKHTAFLHFEDGITEAGKYISGEILCDGNCMNKTDILHSTDNYFVKDNIYKFDISKLSEYHEENLYDAIESMIKRISPIIIDNTNIISEHALPYVEAAEEFGYEVIVTETQTSWRFDIEELSKRNVHNCPKESI